MLHSDNHVHLVSPDFSAFLASPKRRCAVAASRSWPGLCLTDLQHLDCSPCRHWCQIREKGGGGGGRGTRRGLNTGGQRRARLPSLCCLWSSHREGCGCGTALPAPALRDWLLTDTSQASLPVWWSGVGGRGFDLKPVDTEYFRCSCCLLVACLTSQRYASVSQGRTYSDKSTCRHTEIEVACQTFYLAHS